NIILAANKGYIDILEWFYKKIPELFEATDKILFNIIYAITTDIDVLKWFFEKFPELFFKNSETTSKIISKVIKDENIEILEFIHEKFKKEDEKLLISNNDIDELMKKEDDNVIKKW